LAIIHQRTRYIRKKERKDESWSLRRARGLELETQDIVAIRKGDVRVGTLERRGEEE
jgi:hypothetical protein